MSMHPKPKSRHPVLPHRKQMQKIPDEQRSEVTGIVQDVENQKPTMQSQALKSHEGTMGVPIHYSLLQTEPVQSRLSPSEIAKSQRLPFQAQEETHQDGLRQEQGVITQLKSCVALTKMSQGWQYHTLTTRGLILTRLSETVMVRDGRFPLRSRETLNVTLLVATRVGLEMQPLIQAATIRTVPRCAGEVMGPVMQSITGAKQVPCKRHPEEAARIQEQLSQQPKAKSLGKKHLGAAWRSPNEQAPMQAMHSPCN